MNKKTKEILEWTGVIWVILLLTIGVPAHAYEKFNCVVFLSLGLLASIAGIIVQRLPLNK
jgi:hypothetical protein